MQSERRTRLRNLKIQLLSINARVDVDLRSDVTLVVGVRHRQRFIDGLKGRVLGSVVVVVSRRAVNVDNSRLGIFGPTE